MSKRDAEMGVGSLARRLAARAIDRTLGDVRQQEARLQEATGELLRGAQSLRSGVKERADERLEALIRARHADEELPLSQEVDAVLGQRRQERELRQARAKAREAVLETATTTEQRRILLRVLEGADWAGGEQSWPRYTALLDALVPDGQPEQEMAAHRAIWSLAERGVLRVLSHGEVQVCRPEFSGDPTRTTQPE